MVSHFLGPNGVCLSVWLSDKQHNAFDQSAHYIVKSKLICLQLSPSLWGKKTKQLYKMLCCVIIFLSVSQSLHFSPEGHISFCIQLLSSAQGVDVLFHFDFFSPNLHSPSKMSLRSGVCSAANRLLGLTVFGFPIVADSSLK